MFIVNQRGNLIANLDNAQSVLICIESESKFTIKVYYNINETAYDFLGYYSTQENANEQLTGILRALKANEPYYIMEEDKC